MKKILVVRRLLLVAIIISCNTTEPILLDESIKIAEIDASVIEAYLNVHVNNPSASKEVILERDGQRVMSFTATNADTAITDTGLTENTLYKYKAKLIENGKVIGESSEVGVRTIQPTSHEFSWQTFTFGDPGAGSSSLYDVAIIDENNIWAVGEIYTKDSLGNTDPISYNAVHWDGSRWELKKIYYYGNCSAVKYPPLKSIFAFTTNDIIVSNGGSIGFFNGNTIDLDCRINPLLTGAINKIWGTSSKDFYIVGNKGTIVHYSNGSWQKIENNVSSELDFFDVFGKDDNSPIYFIAASTSNDRNHIIKLDKNKFENVPFNEISTLRSIWYANINKIYLAGTYFFVYENGKWEKLKELSNQTTTSVRGVGSNDIVVAGTKGIINHFNGVTWQSYLTHGEYSDVDIKGNIVVAVGSSSAGEAFIAVGKRN